MPAVSIIIPARNEREKLTRLLQAVNKQRKSYDLEVIVIDNASSDGTRELAMHYADKILTISEDEFSYPRVSNIGAEVATSPLLLFFSAHVVPINEDWLSALRHFNDPTVAGVYSFNPPDDNARFIERKMHNVNWHKGLREGVRYISEPESCILAATNCIIRRNVWEKHPFDEAYGHGGQDRAWALWALGARYHFVRDPVLAVKHSHGLNWFDFLIRQTMNWRKMIKPNPFDRKRLKKYRSIA